MYCKQCGILCSDTDIKCPKCGTKKGKGRRFCDICGMKISQDTGICTACTPTSSIPATPVTPVKAKSSKVISLRREESVTQTASTGAEENALEILKGNDAAYDIVTRGNTRKPVADEIIAEYLGVDYTPSADPRITIPKKPASTESTAGPPVEEISSSNAASEITLPRKAESPSPNKPLSPEIPVGTASAGKTNNHEVISAEAAVKRKQIEEAAAQEREEMLRHKAEEAEIKRLLEEKRKKEKEESLLENKRIKKERAEAARLAREASRQSKKEEALRKKQIKAEAKKLKAELKAKKKQERADILAEQKAAKAEQRARRKQIKESRRLNKAVIEDLSAETVAVTDTEPIDDELEAASAEVDNLAKARSTTEYMLEIAREMNEAEIRAEEDKKARQQALMEARLRAKKEADAKAAAEAEIERLRIEREKRKTPSPFEAVTPVFTGAAVHDEKIAAEAQRVVEDTKKLWSSKDTLACIGLAFSLIFCISDFPVAIIYLLIAAVFSILGSSKKGKTKLGQAAIIVITLGIVIKIIMWSMDTSWAESMASAFKQLMGASS